MPLVIEHIKSPTDDARALIAELDAELSGPYSPDQRHGLDIDRIFQPNLLFFIAHLDSHPVACAGIAFDEGAFDPRAPDQGAAAAEVKRMYVRPHARGRNVAQSLLARLEQEARARGVTRLALETGDAQQAALRFYHRAGFTRCNAFGQYSTMSPIAIERSVFFEKKISIS